MLCGGQLMGQLATLHLQFSIGLLQLNNVFLESIFMPLKLLALHLQMVIPEIMGLNNLLLGRNSLLL
jgi:hypothetical protein